MIEAVIWASNVGVVVACKVSGDGDVCTLARTLTMIASAMNRARTGASNASPILSDLVSLDIFVCGNRWAVFA